jgi:hypothetical protein
MPYIRRQFVQFGKAALAALLVGVILFLDAMAACPALHEWLHKDANEPDHHCAVTLIAHGKVSVSACEIVISPPTVLVEATPHFVFVTFSPAIENLPQGRAPPALCSVS